MVASPLNCLISVIVPSKVLAMSIAPSSVKVASWLSYFSCILACLMPTVSCSWGWCESEGTVALAEEDEGRGDREDHCWAEDDDADGRGTACCSCWRSRSFSLLSSAISSFADLPIRKMRLLVLIKFYFKNRTPEKSNFLTFSYVLLYYTRKSNNPIKMCL